MNPSKDEGGGAGLAGYVGCQLPNMTLLRQMATGNLGRTARVGTYQGKRLDIGPLSQKDVLRPAFWIRPKSALRMPSNKAWSSKGLMIFLWLVQPLVVGPVVTNSWAMFFSNK